MTAAEELRTAARLVRETASKATEGHPAPWHIEPEFNGWWLVGTPAPHLVTSAARKPVADWIALMGPDKAEPLADALDDHADAHSAYDCTWPEDECPHVRLARSITGTTGDPS
ncbi:hypothetical protein [Actinomadura decatromicini]|uniref:Uncharacterized protein n=1 Tax=Actinomadura decatromicini TaxID=2604572 RepID=A0A5D3FBJ0_9ACTN|nr:hypothetical protein [Actinomadura decatromicini]TYK45206.1 hypothetical protein FXF68_31510 [Actinomadura decatromicini]